MATEMVTACSDVIAYFNVNFHSFPKLVFFIRKLEVLWSSMVHFLKQSVLSLCTYSYHLPKRRLKLRLLAHVNIIILIVDVMKNVQDEMLKGESSGQIFAVVHLGQYVELAM